MSAPPIATRLGLDPGQRYSESWLQAAVEAEGNLNGLHRYLEESYVRGFLIKDHPGYAPVTPPQGLSIAQARQVKARARMDAAALIAYTLQAYDAGAGPGLSSEVTHPPAPEASPEAATGRKAKGATKAPKGAVETSPPERSAETSPAPTAAGDEVKVLALLGRLEAGLARLHADDARFEAEIHARLDARDAQVGEALARLEAEVQALRRDMQWLQDALVCTTEAVSSPAGTFLGGSLEELRGSAPAPALPSPPTPPAPPAPPTPQTSPAQAPSAKTTPATTPAPAAPASPPGDRAWVTTWLEALGVPTTDALLQRVATNRTLRDQAVTWLVKHGKVTQEAVDTSTPLNLLISVVQGPGGASNAGS